MKPGTLLVGVAVLFFGEVSLAAPPTKQDCISANEDGQDLRRSGRIRSAIERFDVCSASACPGPLRDDCRRRLAEARRALPTVVFTAKDAAGNPLTDVKVAMDGAPIAETLDGSALAVEPGEHTFDFTASGFSAASKKLVLNEAAKGRAEVVVLEAVKRPDASMAVSVVDAKAAGADGSTQRTVAYVLGAVGLAAVVSGGAVLLKASDDYSAAARQCTDGACAKAGDVTNGNSAASMGHVAQAIMIGGGVVLAGGVVLLLTTPSRGNVAISLTGTGLRLGGSW